LTSTVFDQIRTLASDLFATPPDQISSSSSPETVETWDSVQHLNLVLAVEEKFHLQLSPEEIEEMKTIGDVVKLVEGKLQTAPS
jgi:acyl carrier protein